ncbi:GPI-anchored surface glycoprotein [Echinococcus granulosus]|uniref:GPI-anchored surface glycoprotein n=1 Tax=Echinococcus granulosus TaxID=6210 RepID=W6UGH1_ECHGR|nr:GPI-anchored surface glycoprotein [Echinococcus granulosus]EUB60600.1 GPI-anchored surface glycoprotein [Echinococcus granulosus]
MHLRPSAFKQNVDANFGTRQMLDLTLYYPSLSLSTSEVTVASGRSAFEITCTSVTCAGSCQPPGEVETCQNLMLLRTQIHGGPTTLVAQRGQLEPLWADVLGDLKVLVDEESKMVVRIPRTHTYAGQYQCGCEATDATGTIILSVPTTFRSTDFLTEAIFQRNYTVVYRGKQQYLRDGGGGVIELATEGKGAFFHMMASGITLAPNLRTRVEWSEEGKRKTHETVIWRVSLTFQNVVSTSYACDVGRKFCNDLFAACLLSHSPSRLFPQYSREERVKLYPDVEALTNWTELANRVQARAVYPDARENETVIYRWSLSNQMPGSDVTDVFHLVGFHIANVSTIGFR